MPFAKLVLVGIGLFALGTGCAKKDDPSSTTDISETAQQIGDAMASVDESGGSSGGLAFNEIQSAEKLLARVLPSQRGIKINAARALFTPFAQAAACGATTGFGSCSSNVITRTFGGCTIGGATLTGTVTLTWSDAASDNTCAITANSHSITRVPDFTLTGRRGGSLAVSKTGSVGQRITRTSSGVFSFENDGIRRVITFGGATLFDFTTIVTGGDSKLTVSGNNRSARTLTSAAGAYFRVTNNSSGVTCNYTPTSVTWTSTCNCATSGTWSSTCSDGKSSTLTLTGCGSGTFTMGSESESVTLDRCYSI